MANTIQDPALREQFEEVTVGRILFETLLNVTVTAAMGPISKCIKLVSPQLVKSIGNEFLKKAGKKAVNTGGKKLAKHFVEM